MNCKQIKKQLSAYQDGELSGREEAVLKVHLEQCEPCRKILHELECTWDLLESLTGPEPVPYFYTRLQGRLSEEKSVGWIERILVPVTVVGVIVLGVCILHPPFGCAPPAPGWVSVSSART